MLPHRISRPAARRLALTLLLAALLALAALPASAAAPARRRLCRRAGASLCAGRAGTVRGAPDGRACLCRRVDPETGEIWYLYVDQTASKGDTP
jgi:hypothetical protein